MGFSFPGVFPGERPWRAGGVTCVLLGSLRSVLRCASVQVLRGIRDDRARVVCHDGLAMILSGCGQLPRTAETPLLSLVRGGLGGRVLAVAECHGGAVGEVSGR